MEKGELVIKGEKPVSDRAKRELVDNFVSPVWWRRQPEMMRKYKCPLIEVSQALNRCLTSSSTQDLDSLLEMTGPYTKQARKPCYFMTI